MNFEKKNNIYKISMIIIVTALITFMFTFVGVYNYCENEEEASKTLISRIKLVRSYLDKDYIDEITNEDELIEYAVKGYVAGLGDEYTEYYTKEEYEELLVDVNGDYVGIGIYMAQDTQGNVVVLLPIEGSPAEEAELQTGDIITKVDGEDCTEMELSVVANKIKGKAGTTVNLEILRDNQVINKTVERRMVEINQVKSQVLENNIGYIQLVAFDRNSSMEFEAELNSLLQENIKSLIIDVRDNGGGIVEEATNIAELFVPKGKTIMSTLDKNNKEVITKATTNAKVDSSINIIILANENSASASEILIGALKDNNIAKVVGTRTFGKGVVQEIVPLSGGGALKITIEEFYTPNGNAINKKGIEPDIEVIEDEETENDEQLQKAIELCK